MQRHLLASHAVSSIVRRISSLLERGWTVVISHIFWESNWAADRLAHIGHLYDFGVQMYNGPPLWLVEVIWEDLVWVA